jgi:serine/threonine-protein kinase HipA
MPEQLDVYLSGRPAGTLGYAGPSDYTFTYDRAWLDEDDAIPISYSLPLDQIRHSGHRVLDFVDNLLPDGEAVRDRWAIEAGLARSEPFGLLAVYGRDVAGALEFYPAGQRRDDTGGHASISDAQIARRIAAIRQDDDSWNDGSTTTGRFSLGGAQGKFALALTDEGWHEPTGVEATTHIFKPQVRGHDDGELVEAIVMLTAATLGLQTAHVTVEKFVDQRSLVVRRFDRVLVESSLQRVPQEDLCQALGLPRLRKYEVHGGPSYRMTLALLDRVCSPRERQSSKRRYLESLFFSWLVLNTDAHAKNTTLQMGTDGAVLSPLYDVSSLIPYLADDRDGGLEGAMSETNLSNRLVQSYAVADMGWVEWRGAAVDAGVPPNDFLQWCAAAIEAIGDVIPAAARQIALPGESAVVDRLVARMPIRVEQARRQMREPRI